MLRDLGVDAILFLFSCGGASTVSGIKPLYLKNNYLFEYHTLRYFHDRQRLGQKSST